jgi:hypothetical protein
MLCVFPSACAVASEEANTYRYRLTVEVETPQGLRTGSSVIQVITDEAGKHALISPGRLTVRIFGEAVSIDLPNGKKLFALLSRPNGTSDAASGYAPTAYGAPDFESDLPRQLAEWLKRQHRVAVLPPRDPRVDLKRYTNGSDTIERVGPAPVDPQPTYYPMLVTFGNLNDPKTVVSVDARHLDRTFGPGYSLRRITTEITHVPVTRVLEKQLPWLSNLRNGGYVRGDFSETQRDLNLGWDDFIEEQR